MKKCRTWPALQLETGAAAGGEAAGTEGRCGQAAALPLDDEQNISSSSGRTESFFVALELDSNATKKGSNAF